MADCRACCKTIPPSKNYQVKVYCNNRCQLDYENKVRVAQWLAGETPGWTGATRQVRDFVRNYLHASRGTACSVCGWDVRHPVDGSVLTEVDHIDGDAENCTPGNLRILCPNCHAMTPTFRARNRSSKRVRN